MTHNFNIFSTPETDKEGNIGGYNGSDAISRTQRIGKQGVRIER